MHEPCISCQKVGASCRGPRLTDMTIAEAIALMKARKKFLGWSNQQLADRANKTPKGTVDGIFAATHADFRYETIRPVWNALFSSDASDNPCPELSDNERAKYEEKIRQLEAEHAQKDDKIADLTQQKSVMQTLIANTNKRNEDQLNSLHKLLDERYKFLKRKDRVIVILGVLLGLCVATIIAALIIDRLNSDMGFFWLESVLNPHGINEILQKWTT